MTTRFAWLISCALLAFGACSDSSDNLDTSAEASPDTSLDVRTTSGAVTASPAALDLGVALPKRPAGAAAVDITNRGFVDVTLSPVTVSAPFEILTQSCGKVLAAGATCFVLVTVTPSVIGPITGALTLPSSANTLIVPLRAGGGFMVSALVNANGAQVTSDPAGIAPVSVGGLYQGLFPTAVTLTAVPPLGGTFLGWDPACGDGGPTCVVPVPGFGAGAVSVLARFQPSLDLGPRITVDVTGSAAGEVFIVDDATTKIVASCLTSPCVASVPAGHHVTLSAYSSSQFGGWTGDCVATTHDCELGAVTSDRTVAVAFNRDPLEVVTFLSGDIPHSVAFAPDGGLYLSYLDVRKLRLDGTIEWRAPLAGAHDLATDAAGNVYGVNGVDEVFSLSPTGAMRWSKSITVATLSIESAVQVSSDGAVVAVHTADGARVLDGDGGDRFAITGLTGGDGFALAPDGTLAIGVPAAAVNRRDVRRWTRDGTPLPTLASLSGNFAVSLALDAGDAVCGVTVGAGVETVSRTLSTASLAFRSSALTGFSSLLPLAGIGVDRDGAIVVARSTDPTFAASGMHVDAFSPTGAKLLTLDKKGVQQALALDGVQIGSFAVDRRSRRVALVGTYTELFGWIEVLELPAVP